VTAPSRHGHLTVADALEPLSALVPHLRWRAAPPGPDDVVGTELAGDPARLARVVADSAAGRGSDDPQVLGSLWWQAYCHRVAGGMLAAHALTGAAPDPSAPGTGVGLARSRPSSLLVDPDAVVVEDLDSLVDRLFAGHLDPLAASLRSRHPLGLQLIWGDAAAGIASALGAVATADGAPALRSRVDEITAVLPHDIGRLGTWAPDGWAFRRATCCLWWKTAPAAAAGAWCEDCSLRGRERS
jgi:ferric iron reductase protein FhuF